MMYCLVLQLPRVDKSNTDLERAFLVFSGHHREDKMRGFKLLVICNLAARCP